MAIVGAAIKGEIQIYTSTVSFVECVHINGRDRLSPAHEEIIQRFFEHRFIRPINCDRQIAVEARKLLWRYPSLKYKDAIHVASALDQRVDAMHTYDNGDLIPLSNKLGIPALRICQPEYTNPSPLPLPTLELPLSAPLTPPKTTAAPKTVENRPLDGQPSTPPPAPPAA